jgi:glucan biosynthesis protein C
MSTKEKESTANTYPLIPEVRMARLLYLDNLRSFALFLGIIFHAAIVYAPSIGYAIQDERREDVFGYFCYFIHSFRMPLFFLISGYFSALVWEKKGKSAYIEGRILRIFIPMSIGLLFLAPIQYYLVGKIKNPDLQLFSFLADFLSVQKFAHSHIWFLVDLLLFSAFFILFPKRILKYLTDSLPRNIYLLLGVFCIFTFSLTLLAHSFFPRGDDILGIDKLTFFYQFGFFICGVFSFYAHTIFEPTIELSSIVLLNWFTFGLLILILFYQIEITDPLWMPYFYGGVTSRMWHLFLWCLSPFVWTRFFVLLFQSIANVSNPFTVYLVNASLPIYLLHHPISLLTAFFFRNLDIPVYAKFCLHTFIVLGFSFLIYDTLIKNTIILRRLFGLK